MPLDRTNAAQQRAFVDRNCPQADGVLALYGGGHKSVRGTLFNDIGGHPMLAVKHNKRWIAVMFDTGVPITIGHATRSNAMIEAQRLRNLALGYGP